VASPREMAVMNRIECPELLAAATAQIKELEEENGKLCVALCEKHDRLKGLEEENAKLKVALREWKGLWEKP